MCYLIALKKIYFKMLIDLKRIVNPQLYLEMLTLITDRLKQKKCNKDIEDLNNAISVTTDR